MKIQRYAAIDTDGTRPVVWGIGDSPEQAREDAHYWLQQSGMRGERRAEREETVAALRIVEVSEERYERIGQGDADASDL